MATFSKLQDFAALAEGLDATQAEAAAVRLIANEQSLSDAVAYKVSLSTYLSLNIGTNPYLLRKAMLNFFGEIPHAPVGQEKRLGGLVKLTSFMHRTQMVQAT